MFSWYFSCSTYGFLYVLEVTVNPQVCFSFVISPHIPTSANAKPASSALQAAPRAGNGPGTRRCGTERRSWCSAICLAAGGQSCRKLFGNWLIMRGYTIVTSRCWKNPDLHGARTSWESWNSDISNHDLGTERPFRRRDQSRSTWTWLLFQPNCPLSKIFKSSVTMVGYGGFLK